MDVFGGCVCWRHHGARDCDSSTRVEAEDPQNGCLNEMGVLAREMRRAYVHLLTEV